MGGNRFIGYATGLEQVPMRDDAQGAPGKARIGHEVHHPETPRQVWVWLVLPNSGDYRAKGDAIGWVNATDCRQVYVRYIDRIGREGFVWVWADAVRPR